MPVGNHLLPPFLFLRNSRRNCLVHTVHNKQNLFLNSGVADEVPTECSMAIGDGVCPCGIKGPYEGSVSHAHGENGGEADVDFYFVLRPLHSWVYLYTLLCEAA